MTKTATSELVAQIEAACEGELRQWKVGSCEDLVARRKQSGYPSGWQAWPVDTAEISKQVRDELVAKGIRRDYMPAEGARFVYVFSTEKKLSNSGQAFALATLSEEGLPSGIEIQQIVSDENEVQQLAEKLTLETGRMSLIIPISGSFAWR